MLIIKNNPQIKSRKSPRGWSNWEEFLKDGFQEGFFNNYGGNFQT